LTTFLLDSTALIAHLRGDETTTRTLLSLLSAGHVLSTTCVNIAEIERGLKPKDQRRARALMDRLHFLETTREASRKAGRYQADLRRRGKTLDLADALIAGTARAHGATVVTENVNDFPMRDVRVRRVRTL